MLKRTSVIFVIILVANIFQIANALEWERVVGTPSAGVRIPDERPLCWFSPSHSSIEPPSESICTNISFDIHGRVIEYYESATGNGYPVESYGYGGKYNSEGQVTAFEEVRYYPASGNGYHISVSNAIYDDWGDVLDGYDVTVSPGAERPQPLEQTEPQEQKYSGGTGEPNDPYRIATAEDLMLLGETLDDYDKHFILTADIDLDPNLPGRRVFDQAVIAPDIDPNDKDSGSEGRAFEGVFNGNDHTISHLVIKGESFLGLFGTLHYRAEVKYLKLEDVNIIGSGCCAGGLAGANHYGTITHCSFVGMIRGSERAGGLVGGCLGFMAHCHSDVVVNGQDNIGGIVGENLGFVIGSYSTGSVNGCESVGGIVGSNLGNVVDCYSTGVVNGDQGVGGFAGANLGTITNCYSSGAVTGIENIGGLIGEGPPENVNNSFWNIETSGQIASPGGGKGLTTAEMKNISTYTKSGWDFVNERENGTSQIWQVSQEKGYPTLAAFNGYAAPLLQGAGTPNDPYLISNASELGAMVHYSPFTNYRLDINIDLSGIRWSSAVIPWFGGHFDGNDKKIINMEIKGGKYLGLFGLLCPDAEVMNLGVADVNVVNLSQGFCGGSVGGLAGLTVGSVLNCWTTGVVRGVGPNVGGLLGESQMGSVVSCWSNCTVAGSSDSGGLIGCNSLGSINGCYSAGMVSGHEHVGGLLGSGGHILNCCSTSMVSGYKCVGGLVGSGDSITNSYSTGAVSGNEEVGGLVGFGTPAHVISSFWDVQTSGQISSAGGGIGLTTAEMQDIRTYTEAGWDFIGETANGNDDIWWILEGQSYPRLWWELISDMGINGGYENFNDGNYDGWVLVDQGTRKGPMDWSAESGAMVQSSNVHTLPTGTELPKLGTYAFWQDGTNWTDYQTTVTIKSDDDDAIGIMFRYKDENNYYRFSWYKERNYRCLVKCQDGQFSLLAEDSVPYIIGKSYQLEIVAQGSSMQVYIDSSLIFSVDDSSLSSGTIALYCWGNVGSYFDDIVVELILP